VTIDGMAPITDVSAAVRQVVGQVGKAS